MITLLTGGGLSDPEGLTFGPDGNIYVANGNSVVRFNGTTGAFMDVFVTSGSGGLSGGRDVTFGADGNLYATSSGATGGVLKYNGTTGAFLGAFVGPGSDLSLPRGLTGARGELLNNLGVHSLELRASIEAARGNTTQAKRLFAEAIAAEKALGYHEPPIYIRPAGEAEGAAMLAAGDWADAKAGYEEALKERPRSGFALYGIAFASEKSGDAKAATKEYADFLAAWRSADPTLPQVQHARAYLATGN